MAKPTLRQVLRTTMALSLLLSCTLTGLSGMVIVPLWGAEFGMFLWMIAADTPERPNLPYPWLAAALAACLPLYPLHRRSWLIASVAAIPFALLPFVQLYRLYLAARPTSWE